MSMLQEMLLYFIVKKWKWYIYIIFIFTLLLNQYIYLHISKVIVSQLNMGVKKAIFLTNNKWKIIKFNHQPTQTCSISHTLMRTHIIKK